MIHLPAWLMMNSYTVIIVLLLLYFNMRNRQQARPHTAFRKLLIVLLFLLMGDSISRIYAGHPEATILLVTSNVLMFGLDPLMYYFLIHYIECCMEQEPKRRMSNCLILPITLVNSALLIIEQCTGNPIFFRIVDGFYQRGPYFLPRAIVMLGLCLTTEIFILVNRKNFLKSYYIPLLFFPILILLFGALQVIFLGIGLQYMGIALACLILFVYIQNRDVNEDYLTSVQNRRGFYGALHHAMQDRRTQSFALVTIDVDKFKEINDVYGHQAGDQALVDLSEVLQKSFRHNDVIGRLGGDEFSVLMFVRNEGDLYKALGRLRANLALFNEKNARPYTLAISIGASMYDHEHGGDADLFLQHVDALLYQEKEKHHQELAEGKILPFSPRTL